MSTDNRTEINDCESSSGFQGDGSPNFTTLAGQFYEGTGSIQGQHSDTDEESYTNDDSAGAAFSIDLSDATVYILLKDNLNNTYANGGIQLVLGETFSDRAGYDIGGSDAPGVDIGKGFRCLKGDGNVLDNTPGAHTVYAGTEANIAFTAIDSVGYGSLHNAKAQGNVANWWLDRMTYIANDSYALTINGGTSGTPETMADVRADDLTNGWGMIGNPLGNQFLFAAPTEWGNATATADVYFTATDEQWFWIGDNGGGRAIGATHFPFRIVGNATDTIDIKWTRVVIVNTGTRAQFTAGDVNVNVMQFESVTFQDLGAITFTTQSTSNRFVDNCVFNNCDQIDMNTIDSDGCTWNGTTDALGAIILNATGDSDNILNATFNSDGTGHAVYITATGTYDFDNWLFNGYSGTGANAAVYNNSGGAVTINILNGGDTPSVRNGTSATTTVNNSVNVSLTGVTYGTPVKFIANETVGTITAGDVLSEGFADSTGTYAFTQNYEAAFNPSGLDVRVVARNQGVAVKCWQEDASGPSFIDETADASSNATGDVALFPNPVGANDAFYIGHDEQFGGFKIDISTAGVGTYTTATEYWNGTAWSALTVTRADNADLKSTGTDDIFKWNIPSDWATTSVNSVSLYYIRIRYVSGTMTTNPVASKLSVDASRYLPYDEIRVISSTGLLDNASWRPDTISKFSQT